MKRTYKIALVQAAFRFGDIAHNLERMKDFLNQVILAEPEVRLVMFPELAVNGYYLSPSIRQTALQQAGAVFQHFSRMAREHSVFIGYGYAELGEQGELFNAYQLIDSTGELLNNYRKIHLPAQEKKIFAPGYERGGALTSIGRIGILICWDLALSHLAQRLVEDGAELILVPAAWEKPLDYPEARFVPPLFAQQRVFFAFCNQVGDGGGTIFFGNSAVHAPDGSKVSVASEELEQILIATITLEQPSSR